MKHIWKESNIDSFNRIKLDYQTSFLNYYFDKLLQGIFIKKLAFEDSISNFYSLKIRKIEYVQQWKLIPVALRSSSTGEINWGN